MADPWSTIGYLLSYWKSPQGRAFSSCRSGKQQHHHTVHHRLVKQIDEQGMPSQKGQGRHRIFLENLRYGAPGKKPPQKTAGQEKEDPRQDGIIVRGIVSGTEAQRKQHKAAGHICHRIIEIPGEEKQHQTHRRARPHRDLTDQRTRRRVQQHAAAKEVQYAEGDGLIRHHHSHDGGDQQTAGKGLQTTLPVAAGETAGDACQHHQHAHKAVPEVVHARRTEKGVVAAKDLTEIVEHMIPHHKDDADAPHQIQQMIPFFHISSVLPAEDSSCPGHRRSSTVRTAPHCG